MRHRARSLLLPALLLSALALAACDGDTSPPTATPTRAPQSTNTPVASPTSASPSATATSRPIVPGTPTATVAQGPTITVGAAPFRVEIARTGDEQARGLGGRPSLAPATGMLFPQSNEAILAFWMKGMLIPLDFVWIDAKCAVADLTTNVPPPRDPNQTSGLPIYSPSRPVMYVLELTAGDVASKNIKIGDKVQFAGFQVSGPGCP